MEIIVIAQMESNFEHINRIYDVNGLAPTLTTPGGGVTSQRYWRL